MATLSVLELMDRYGDLGAEFLTWLLVRVRSGAPITTGGEDVEVAVSGPMVFAAAGGEATKVAVAGDEAAGSAEVASALREGKRMVRARIGITALDARYDFTLDGETFDIRGAALPVPKVPDADEFLTMRVQAVQHLYGLMANLFESFLVLRLDARAWRAEVESWRDVG